MLLMCLHHEELANREDFLATCSEEDFRRRQLGATCICQNIQSFSDEACCKVRSILSRLSKAHSSQPTDDGGFVCRPVDEL